MATEITQICKCKISEVKGELTESSDGENGEDQLGELHFVGSRWVKTETWICLNFPAIDRFYTRFVSVTMNSRNISLLSCLIEAWPINCQIDHWCQRESGTSIFRLLLIFSAFQSWRLLKFVKFWYHHNGMPFSVRLTLKLFRLKFAS